MNITFLKKIANDYFNNLIDANCENNYKIFISPSCKSIHSKHI